MIHFEDVSKVYEGADTPAVERVTLTANSGELLVLLGSSGSGKSTLLKMVNRLLEPTAGKIKVDGTDLLNQDPVSLRRRIGYVFQGIGLFPHLSVQENASMIPRLLGAPPDKQRDIAQRFLRLVDLPPSDFAERFPGELSGGQQQRVAVARALAAEPDFLLMDEPFGALDAITRENLQGQLLRIASEIKKTIIFVTHDIFEALRLGDRIAVMHEGHLEQVGNKEDLLQRPTTQFVKDLFEHPRKQIEATQKLFALPQSPNNEEPNTTSPC